MMLTIAFNDADDDAAEAERMTVMTTIIVASSALPMLPMTVMICSLCITKAAGASIMIIIRILMRRRAIVKLSA